MNVWNIMRPGPTELSWEERNTFTFTYDPKLREQMEKTQKELKMKNKKHNGDLKKQK